MELTPKNLFIKPCVFWFFLYPFGALNLSLITFERLTPLLTFHTATAAKIGKRRIHLRHRYGLYNQLTSIPEKFSIMKNIKSS